MASVLWRLLFSLLTVFLFVSNSHANCPDVTASFTLSPTSVCGPGFTPISFVNTSTGLNAATSTYKWYKNGALFDNTVGLAAPINSSVNAVGTYTFRLIATDASVPCTDTFTVTVVVHPIPVASFTFTPNNACAGTSVVFTNTSTGTEAATSYLWNFGDGFTSTATNPTHVYAAGGTYNVTLTMTNGVGCTSSFNASVTALPIPVPAIAGDDGDGNTTNCLLPGDPTTSETVTFTNTTTGAVSYLWDFGDATTSTAVNPSHTYSSFGTYTVTMTATGANGCTATATITVVFEKYVSSSLTLSITEYSGCAPHTLTTLANLSVNANTYTWNFGDGTPPVTTTSPVPPTHTYTTGGTYTISLTASNSCNTAMATISPIVIVAGPNANFFPSTTLGCAPQNISFANTSTGASPANNYQWDMGNGNTYTNVTTPPVQSYPTQGTYTVTLIAGSACGHDTMVQTIIIDSIPVADIVSNPLIGCSPLTVATTNNSYGNSLTYAWYVDGVYVSNASTLGNQIFTAPAGNTPQTHTIALTVSNHCGTDSDAETIVVHPAVVAQYSMTTDTICVGSSVTFTDASLGDMLVWSWDFDNGTTSALQGPHTITYNTPGTYQISLIVNGFCGPDTLIQTLIVLPYPIADFTLTPPSGCIPNSVSFTNNSTLGASYSWTFGTGSTPTSSTVYAPAPVTYSTAGTSTVILTVNALGCISRDTNYVITNPLPIPAFTLLPSNGCSPLVVNYNNTSAITIGDTYLWDFGNGNTSTAYSPPSQTYLSGAGVDATYTVTLTITSATGCVDSLSAVVTVHPLPIADFTPLPDTVCAGTAVAFLNNSVGANSYNWNFGDGGTSIVMSPAHTYFTDGLFTATLIATTVYGCSDTISHNIYVDSIPTADFSFTVECMGDTTHFTDLSIGGVTNWAWNFGDGNNSTQQNPDYLYAVNGTYNVSLTVTNPAGCTHSQSHLVNVNLVPVAAFTTSSTCLGQPSNFTDISTGSPASWIWDFGDGSPVSTLQNPTHTYGAIGTYTVQLIAFGGAGCSDTVSGTITVTPIPTANFAFVSVCTNDTTFFASTSLGAPDTYFWDFGDGTTDNTNNPTPTHVYTVSGTYNVTLVAGYSASGCTHTVSIPVDANPRTVPTFSNNTPCLGAPTNFIDLTSNSPISWDWNFGDGASSTLQNPSHTYGAPGFYTVTLVTSNVFACTDSITATIQVFALPVAAFTFDTICATFSTSFIDQSTFASQWQWNFGDGSGFDLNSNPNHVFPSSGSYTVQQVVTNAAGCTDTSTQNVIVNPNPVAAFSSTIACHTYPNSFTDLSAGAVTWDWDFGDGSANDFTQNPLHTYPLDGSYTVELVVTNIFGCSDSITQNASVLLQPQSAFTNTTVCAGQTVLFSDNTTGTPTTWQWDFGDGSAVVSLQNPTHVFATGGSYTITLITGNAAGCMDTLITPINVFTVPVPNFSSDTVCLFSITHLIDLTTDAVALATWFWDFSDGNTSPSQNPNYIFMAPGTYNVSLTVTNINGCDTSITLPVIVNDIPVAAFSADTACVGGPTNFTDLSTGSPTQWTWNFGDGTVSNIGPNVSHTYPGPGTYVVTLIVGDATGVCTDMTIQIVTVSNTVTASFTMPDTVCVGELVNFTNTSTVTGGASISSSLWDFGNGHISPLTNPTQTYDTPGTYWVTLTVTSGGGCTSVDSLPIFVAPIPTASFTTVNACDGAPVSFNSSSVGSGVAIANTLWYFGDGTTANGVNVTHTYPVSGTYNVSLVVTSVAGCKDSLTLPVTINPLPVADFTNNIVCLGDSVNFIDMSTVATGTIINWAWSFGDGTTSMLQNPIHEYLLQNDTFTVSLIVTSNFGCKDTVVHNAITLPIVDFNFGPDAINGCAPLFLNFNDNSTSDGGSIVGWVWNFDDGNFSFAQNPTHYYPNDGSYYVSLTVTTNDGCTFTDTLNYAITVYPQPQAGFSMNPPTTSIFTPEIEFTNLAIGATYYEWDFGDMNYSNLPNPEHYYTEPGTYSVMQIVYNGYGCSDTAIHEIIILEESTLFAPNAVSPNGDGVNEVFYTRGTGIVEYELYIFDRWGELLFESHDQTQGWDCTYKGYVVKSDVYVWKVVVVDLNNEKQTYLGHVTVLR